MTEDSSRPAFAVRLEAVPALLYVALAIPIWIGYCVYAHLGSRFSLDLRVYRAATNAFLAGHNPFALHFTSYRLPFTYPPFALLPLSVVAHGNIQVIETLWWFANLCATVSVLYLGLSRTLKLPGLRALLVSLSVAPIVSLMFEPLRSNTNYGQINMFLLLLVMIDIISVHGKARGVGVGIAAALKLTPLVFLVYFLVSRDRRALLKGLVTFVICGLIGLAFLPRASANYWSTQIFEPGRTGSVSSARNQSLNGLLHRFPFSSHGTIAGWIVISLISLACGTYLARRLILQGRTIDAVVALGLTSELVSPISWSHHFVWVALVPLVLAKIFRDQPTVAAVLVLLMAVAAVGPYAWLTHGWDYRIFSDSLGLVTFLGLITWSISEFHRTFGPDRTSNKVADASPSPREAYGQPFLVSTCVFP
jgi:alpha-1,2-mannosyltransferase